MDDNSDVLDMLSRYLGKWGYRTYGVTTAAEAISRCDSEAFHLAIVDIGLGDSDGLELLEILKTKHPALAIIIFTGAGYDEELLNEALAHRASGYLSKGQPISQVLMEIHRVLGKPGNPA